MTSPRPAARRSRRSVRTLAAVVLIVSALVAGTAAIVVASATVLAVALAYAVTVCSVAARLLADETAQVRRDWARDRAVTAHEQSREATRRAREQVAFADTMAERVRSRDARVSDLLDEVEAAEDALAEARAAHHAAAQRADTLDTELARTRHDLAGARAEARRLRDELATLQATELELRTELLAWQQRSEEQRRLA